MSTPMRNGPSADVVLPSTMANTVRADVAVLRQVALSFSVTPPSSEPARQDVPRDRQLLAG
jgi:hypothetical protein